jgi:hypothetical protein
MIIINKANIESYINYIHPDMSNDVYFLVYNNTTNAVGGGSIRIIPVWEIENCLYDYYNWLN